MYNQSGLVCRVENPRTGFGLFRSLGLGLDLDLVPGGQVKSSQDEEKKGGVNAVQNARGKCTLMQ
ncbi:uncharacterized protein N7511_004085 [Penicillium nucicola]|uniref:uncharacterized protein n=1 Tax=Penicillium nucicola TaxID=1850975 RepID=UPI0025456E8B|nr:uncharacterized protein N7511_004085 [Penicillium nucicola]KAJ5766469.1 hypothetical protein N7511_004085 [Penicillium nucicola]